MEEIVAVVTYTKDGYKKRGNRKYFDGILKINQQNRFAQLFNEDGKFISSGKLPEEVELEPIWSDEFELEKHLLIIIDSVRSPEADTTSHKENTIPASQKPNRVQYSTKTSRIMLPLPPSTKPLVPNHSSTTTAQHHIDRSNLEILNLLSMTPSSTISPQLMTQNTTLNSLPIKKEDRHSTAFNNNNQIQQYDTSANATGFPMPSVLHPRPPLPIPRTASLSLPSIIPPQQQRPNIAPKLTPKMQAVFDHQQNTSRLWQRQSVHSMHQNTSPSYQPIPGQIYFPTEKESSSPERHMYIPTAFSSLQEYQKAWEASLSEEITLKISEVAKNFYATRSSPHVKNMLEHSLNTAGAGAILETAMRRAKIDYYGSCELFIWKNHQHGKSTSFHDKKRRKNQKYGTISKRNNTMKTALDEYDTKEDEEEKEDVPFKPENIYLTLKSGRSKSTDYCKGDVWIISNDPLFRSGFDPGQIGDRNRAPWTAVAKSLWHGPNQDGKFEIDFVSPRPSSLSRSQPIYALKSHDASMELSLLDLVRSGLLHQSPIMQHLLHAGQCGPPSSASSSLFSRKQSIDGIAATNDQSMHGDAKEYENEEKPPPVPAPPLMTMMTMIMEQADAIISSFNLNQDQAAVLRHAASWTNTDNTDPRMKASPICLIHGPFGTGKSSLLVALLHFFLSIRKHIPSSPLASARILVTAHTNVAVDRVLLGLVDSGITDFLRVGPLRRIHRRLLPYSLHASESRAHATAAAELKEMLRESAGNPIEESILRAELAVAEQGAERQRKKLLKTSPIIGVTCCSSMLSVLDGLVFDITLLDEASQMIEPLSLAPMLRAKCSYLIAAGDPLQLPPVIAHPSTCQARSGDGGDNGNEKMQGLDPRCSLIRPLFVRLAALGNAPYLLRQQYRCHPAICAVPNTFFYGNRLLNGCTAEQRPSLLPGLPAVVCLDVRGQEERSGRSIHNMQEARAVARVIERLASVGVSPSRCGVICFYKAQVTAVRSLLLLQQQQQQQQQGHAPGSTDTPRTSTSTDIKTSECCTGNNSETINNETGTVQVATVDAFQGAEKDVVILTTSTTRGSNQFAADECRLNVALTRARHNLVVIGCAPALQKSSRAFEAIIKGAKSTPGGFSGSGVLPLMSK